MNSHQRVFIANAVVLIAGLAWIASAQTPHVGRGSGMYDLKAETTITGTIESIETITGPAGGGRRGLGGTHLIVKTGTETVGVHVGPTAYLTEHKITLAKGDRVEILGSRVTIDNEPFLLARKITRGDDSWMLRDGSGRPLWSNPLR